MSAIAEMTEVSAKAAGTNGHSKRGKGVLSLDAILAASDIEFDYVDVPEWGGTVRVRSLTGAERDKIVRSDMEQKGPAFYARVIAASLVDDEGNNIGDSTTAAALVKKNAGALHRVWKACQRLSGMGEEAVERAKDDLKTLPSDDTSGD